MFGDVGAEAFDEAFAVWGLLACVCINYYVLLTSVGGRCE